MTFDELIAEYENIDPHKTKDGTVAFEKLTIAELAEAKKKLAEANLIDSVFGAKIHPVDFKNRITEVE